jgi:hypothetical protein
METTTGNQFAAELEPQPERPQFLKILCILSFIACGLMILIYAIGTTLLGVSEEMISNAGIWDKVVEANPQFENVNPMEFLHQFGMVCVYCLIANIFSLVGVIMMWRLEKIGFFIYVIAELSTNFFGLDLNTGEETKSYGGMIFTICIDLVFIVMYFLNLKYMNKKNLNRNTSGV